MKKLLNELEVRKLQNLALKWFSKHWLKFTGIKPKKLQIPTSTMTHNIKKVIAPFKKILIHLNLLALAIIFIACGSDDITNTGTNPPPSNNDILVIDSITASTSNMSLIDSTIYFTNNDFDSLKISFTAETNTTQFYSPEVTVVIKDTNGTIIAVSCTELSQFHDYTVYTKTNNINYKVEIFVHIGQFAIPSQYVRLKNLHITKVQ